MEKYVLGIDQGTTGSKAILFDKKSNIIAQAYSEFEQHYPQPGWVEHDANEILDVTMKVVKEALAKGNVDIAQVDAIGITNQRETTVFWDKETGEPVCRAIVWQDRRSLGVVEDLLAMDPEVGTRTGARQSCQIFLHPRSSGFWITMKPSRLGLLKENSCTAPWTPG
jgi:glycerol kinase